MRTRNNKLYYRKLNFKIMHAYQNAVYTLHDRDKRNHINILVLQLSNHLVTLLDPGNSIVDKLINDSFGGLLLVDNCGTLAH